MMSWGVFTGILLLLASGWLISNALNTKNKLWTTIGITLFVGIALALTIDYTYKHREPIEEVPVEFGYIEYPFGRAGIKALQEPDGTVTVISCYQGSGDVVGARWTNCWDHKVQWCGR